MEEAKVIQQWGAFYLFRKALQIKTKSELWYIEAGKIIVKITACLIALIFDTATGVLYLVFITVKVLVIAFINTISKIFEILIAKLLSVFAYLIALISTVAILYELIKHWNLFKRFVDTITIWING